MYSKLISCGLLGIDGYIVEVETDISSGMPVFDIVGLGDTTIREARERVRAAVKNAGYEFPIRRITMNLAPANIKKEGSSFDLAIALGVMASIGEIDFRRLEHAMFIGELSLDGEIRPVKGVLSIALCALENGISHLVLPEANVNEASVVKGLKIVPVRNLKETVDFINNGDWTKVFKSTFDYMKSRRIEYDVDFSDVKGQENVKRALEVAASGGHNCLMLGGPGCGKTMLAKRLPTILPSMTFEEALEVTKIHSISGILPPRVALLTARPFRSPHHTISDTGLVGGGTIPKPGEISMAHFGVLFLDELPEFTKKALEVLRQPLEDGVITISRVSASLTYPAKTTLICAANPCKCGRFLEPPGKCTCTPRQVQQYLGKLSGPLIDRMDIHIEVASVKYRDLESASSGDTSAAIRERVEETRKIQLERYKDMRIFSNSQLRAGMLSKFCSLNDKSKEILKNAFDRMGMSARAYSRILKVSRTIADMDKSDDIKCVHLAEALQYRSLDRKIWGL